MLISHCCLCKKSKCQICTHTIFFSATATHKEKLHSTQERIIFHTGLGMLRIWPTDIAGVFLIQGKLDPNALTMIKFLDKCYVKHQFRLHIFCLQRKKYDFTLKIFNIQKLIYVQRISWIATNVKLLYIELICNFKPSTVTGMLE